ncbi:MAG: DUF6305 family protein [Spirochaetes bacterium]|nr:DUF6305 family protein [Spirochaetota bacterium]
MKTREKFLIAAMFVFSVAPGVGAQSYNLKSPIADKPVFLTSAGQSADIEMVKVLLDRSKIEYKADAMAKTGAIKAAGGKTLLIAIGGSSKGLGAAGVSQDVELARVKEIVAEAKKLGIKIIGVHVGGEARRGELSDGFIAAIVPLCDYVIVVAEGNKDGLFTKLCAQAKIPLDSVDKISKVGDPLLKAFR